MRKGDPIVDLSDNDPAIMERMAEERDQILRGIEQGESRVRSLEDRIDGLVETQDTSVQAAALREQMARERVTASEQALTAARAAQVTAQLNLERQQALSAKGLTSTRNVELAVLDAATRTADADRAIATLERRAQRGRLARRPNCSGRAPTRGREWTKPGRRWRRRGAMSRRAGASWRRSRCASRGSRPSA